jgi:hypothetical protein
VWHADLLLGDCAGEYQQQFNRQTEWVGRGTVASR